MQIILIYNLQRSKRKNMVSVAGTLLAALKSIRNAREKQSKPDIVAMLVLFTLHWLRTLISLASHN